MAKKLSLEEAQRRNDPLGERLDPRVVDARAKWKWCNEFYAPWMALALDDLRFAMGDSDNNWQWPMAIYQKLTNNNKPCLTINMTQQHNLQVVNEARQAKSRIRTRAAGNGATAESAGVFDQLIAEIEYRSRAQEVAYDNGRKFQVNAGCGAWRVLTEWREDEWLQDARIAPLDFRQVFVDPNHRDVNGLDAEFALIYDNVPRAQAERLWPEYSEQLAASSPLGIGPSADGWDDEHTIRICEFFYKERKADTLVLFTDPDTGDSKSVLKSKIGPDLFERIKDDSRTRTRKTTRTIVRWVKIIGSRIVEETTWPGKYIPVVLVPGERIVIDGQIDMRSHTRAMKSAQRMFNYNASAQVEQVALQTKTPWIADAKSIEPYKNVWRNANTGDEPVLPYDSMDDAGEKIPPPQRIEPPIAASGFTAGMEAASQQMMMASGQWQNQMGMIGNERTGAAINARQGQGDTATYHFKDVYESGLIATGKILIDLLPKIMDVQQVLRIQAEDGEEYELRIDPGAAEAYSAASDGLGKAVQRVFNPSVGKYDVRSVAGAAQGTKREQTVQALTTLITQAPTVAPIIMDKLVGAMDFDGAEEAAQRLRRMIPPAATGQGPSPAEQHMQVQIQQLQGALTKALADGAKNQIKLAGKEQLRDIEVYRAETERLQALADSLGIDPEGLAVAVQQLLQNATQGPGLEGITEANAGASAAPAQGAGPAMPQGAMQASDGNHYMPDPGRPGKYLQVLPPSARPPGGNSQ